MKKVTLSSPRNRRAGVKLKHPMLRARVRQCDGDLLRLLRRAAKILRRAEADVIRIGTQQYAASVVYRAPVQGALNLDA